MVCNARTASLLPGRRLKSEATVSSGLWENFGTLVHGVHSNWKQENSETLLTKMTILCAKKGSHINLSFNKPALPVWAQALS